MNVDRFHQLQKCNLEHEQSQGYTVSIETMSKPCHGHTIVCQVTEVRGLLENPQHIAIKNLFQNGNTEVFPSMLVANT